MEKKILKLPNQFGVKSLSGMLKDIMLEDFKNYCKEKGLDPQEFINKLNSLKGRKVI